MKKFTFVIAVIVAMSFGMKAQAQQNAIKLNIFSLAVGTFNASFEHALNDNHTAQLGFYYLGYKTGGGTYKTSFSGIGITPEYRIYFDEALSGWYIAPYLRYQNYTLKQDYDSYTYDQYGDVIGTETKTAKGTLQTFGGGVVAGHQWLLGEHFTIDLFLGPGYNGGSVKVTDGQDSNVNFSTGLFDGFSIRWGVTFGFAF